MRKPTNLLLISLLLWAISCQSNMDEAKKEQEDPSVEPVLVPEDSTGLAGTVWELVALVDLATGETIAPDCPQNTKWGEACYTFAFDKDKPGAGILYLRWNRVPIDFSTEEVVDKIRNEMMLVAPECNFELFYDASYTIHSYEYKNDELKFFYNDSTACFLFKPYEEKEIFTVPVPDEILGLARKRFELIGLIDAKTDKMVIPCPDYNIVNYYYVQFGEGGKARLFFKCLDAGLHFDRNPAVLWTDFIDSRCNATDPLFEPVSTIESCVYENNQLKLICNNKKNYLLFKLSEP